MIYGRWTVLGLLLFVPFLGNAPLFDWDEVNFATCAKEMLLTGNYGQISVDFKPFWEKPPFFFWLQAGCMALFGVNEFAARLPNALCGALTLPLLVYLGNRMHSPRLGYWWAVLWIGSITPFVYFKSGIIDPWFNVFIFIGIWAWIEYTTSHRLKWILATGLFIGLAVLTKGPVGWLLYFLTASAVSIYKYTARKTSTAELTRYIIAGVGVTVISIAVSLLWFGYEYSQNGDWFIRNFLAYQVRLFSIPDAGHKGFLGYHVVVLLLGCFPAAWWALPRFFRLPDFEMAERGNFSCWMWWLAVIVVVLFSIVTSKIIHYSSLAWFPLTYLAAAELTRLEAWHRSLPRLPLYSVVLLTGLWMIAVLILPWLGQHTEILIPYIKDRFAQQNLTASVVWTGWEATPALILAGWLGWFVVRGYNRSAGIQACSLAFSWCLFLVALTAVVPGKIAQYTQGAAVEFCKKHAAEKPYFLVSGYRSYVPYFYGSSQVPTDTGYVDTSYREWLLSGAAPRPVYVLTRTWQQPQPPPDNCELLYEKAGFQFWKVRLKTEH